MKNKKGFTLIELLAVIVILAIIALIATPIILNMINQARKSAAKSSSLGFIESIETYSGFSEAKATGMEINGYDKTIPSTSDFECTKGTSGWDNTCKEYMEAVEAKSKGKKPDKAVVKLTGAGKVKADSKFYFNKYTCTYDGHDISGCVSGDHMDSSNNNNNNNNEPSQTTYTAYNPGDELYFDPVSTNTCDSEHFSVDAIKNNTSTCYKWRVITVGDTTSKEKITVQMDHNLINKDQWTSGDLNTSGPTKALTDLANATSSWERVSGLNYTYDTTAATNNYGVMVCTNGICKKQGTDTLIAGTTEKPIRARLITGEEIKALTLNAGATQDSNAGTWTLASTSDNKYNFSNIQYTLGTYSFGTGNTSLAWLVENTDSYDRSGATDNEYSDDNDGYWTLSPSSNQPYYAWYVYNVGIINYEDYYGVDRSDWYGVRPVIEMPKNVFK